MYMMYVRNNMKKTLILDSNNLLYRIFFMNRARGTDVNTLLVFLRCVRSYVDMLDGVDDIIAVWDSRLCRGQPNFRREEIEADYKGNRDNETLAEAHVLDDEIQAAIEALGGVNMFPYRMEADDVIAWLTHQMTGNNITVVTVDQDMLQLINENVDVYSPIKKVFINNDNFVEQTGVDKKNFLPYKCLLGDKSDNIPGLTRVGKKTALKMIENGLEQELDGRPAEDRERYNLNYKLMDLSYGYKHHEGEVECYQEQFEKVGQSRLDKEEFKNICLRNKCFAITNKIDNWLSVFAGKISGANLVNLFSTLNNSK